MVIKFTSSKLAKITSFDNFLKDNNKEQLDVIALKYNKTTSKNCRHITQYGIKRCGEAFAGEVV